MSTSVHDQTSMVPTATAPAAATGDRVIPEDLWSVIHRMANGCDWPPRHDNELTLLFEVANQQLVFPLLMADSRVPDAISAAKPRFRAWQALYRRQSEIRQRAIAELMDVLDTDSFLLYKGADYSHRIYAQPDHRVMGDIDILVPENRFEAVVAQLATAGYRQKYSGAAATFAPGYYEAKVLVAGVLVEIHRSFGQRIRAGIDYQAIWQRREHFPLAGRSACRLAPADAILCHAFNLVKDEFCPQLNRFVDFYLLLGRYPDCLPQCVDRAKEWSIERALFGALHITSGLFHEVRTPALADAMQRLLTPRQRRFQVAHVLPNPAIERGSRRSVQIWRKYMLMDRMWRRLAFTGYHLYTSAIGGWIAHRARRQGNPDVR